MSLSIHAAEKERITDKLNSEKSEKAKPCKQIGNRVLRNKRKT